MGKNISNPFLNIDNPGRERVSAASWIDCPGRTTSEPSVALFRLRFNIEEQTTLTIHVSADNRYILFLDGKQLGREPERGDLLHWPYESYELQLAPGEHQLLAKTWWLGELAPFAQLTIRPGFILAATGPLQKVLSTGYAPWEATLLTGREFIPSEISWGAGAREKVIGSEYLWGWQKGEVGAWQPAETICLGLSEASQTEVPPVWLLSPATLPQMLEEKRTGGKLRHLSAERSYPLVPEKHLAAEEEQWANFLSGRGTVTIGPGETRCAIIDLQGYYCAYPQLVVSGGKNGAISLNWAEAFYEEEDGKYKGDRNQIEGKYFIGEADEFLPDGGEKRLFSTLWWRAGRYMELTVQTVDEPLTLESFSLLETRYPLNMEGEFACSDQKLEEIIPLALRGLQMCTHDIYMDCPYYEQLMYVGDTRLEVLVTYVLTKDTRLVRKALRAFANSRKTSGLTQSRYPTRLMHIIPPYSLWWVMMVHDYFLWRDDLDFVRELLPTVRGVTEYFRTLVGQEGLMASPEVCWNYMDWTDWKIGVPPAGDSGYSSVLNLQFALVLLAKAELEEFFGENLLAARDRQLANSIFDAVMERFWDPERGLLADDLEKESFSEHAQILALLTGLLDEQKEEEIAEGLTTQNLIRTSIYFSHYLFETYYKIRRPDKLRERLSLWLELKEKGLKTTFEHPEPSRSDCHGWGAHPLYHFYSSLLGIRPGAPGFKSVCIKPMLGSLSWVKGTMPHPKGEIEVEIKREGSSLEAIIALPAEVGGSFVWEGKTYELFSGRNQIKA